MKTRILASVVVAVSLSLAGSGWAQTAPDAHKLALTKEYMELAQVNKMMNSMMGAMAGSMEMGADVPPEVTTAMREAIVESSAAIFPLMMDRLAQLYADAYSLEDLEAIVAFFKSPAGRSMTAKNEQFIAKAIPILSTEFGGRLKQEMVDRFCVKLACTAEQKAEIMKQAAPGVRP
jgi:hypothetical protein